MVVGPGMMDVDAGLQLHFGSFAKMDAHLRLQPIGELGSYLNTTSNCKLYSVCVCVCVCVYVCVFTYVVCVVHTYYNLVCVCVGWGGMCTNVA